MMTCKTVRVKSAEHAQYGGFKEINESDFDPKTHELFDEAAAAAEEVEAQPAEELTDEMREAAAAAEALMNPKKASKK